MANTAMNIRTTTGILGPVSIRMRKLRLLTFTAILLLVSPPLVSFQKSGNTASAEELDARDLVERWHRRLIAIRDLENRSHASIEGASLAELGRVAFVVGQASDLQSLMDDTDYYSFPAL